MDTNLVKPSTNTVVAKVNWTYQAVFEQAKDCCIVCDPSSGRILALNQKARERLGYTVEEVTALTLDCIHPSSVHEQCKAAFAQMVTTGEVYFETLYRRKDGTTFPVEISASCFEIAGHQIAQGISRDITARKRSHQALQQQLKKEKLIHSLSLRMSLAREKLIHAIALKIRESLNLQTCLQTTANEILNFLKADRVLLYPFTSNNASLTEASSSNSCTADLDRIAPLYAVDSYADLNLKESIAVPDICEANYSLKRKRLLQQLQIRAELIVPILQNDRPWGLIIVHQCQTPRSWKDSEIDLLQKLSIQVTIAIRQADLYNQTRTELAERKRIAQELEKARDEAIAATQIKSEFLAVMSHEIRTPMNGVIGMTDLLLNTPLNAQQHHYASTIRTCGSALLSLLNDILDMSKIESNKLELEAKPFSLQRCIYEAIALLEIEASQKQLHLDTYIPIHIPSAVIGDSTRLRQILINLLSNAIKFTKEGSITVSLLSIEPLAQPHYLHRFTFSVKDTGIGISPDRIDSLFQPFSQADSSISRQYGGTGLGLTISQQLCQMMDGRIWVDTQPQQGSCFYFTVCMQVDNRPAQPTQPNPPLNLNLAERLPLEILVAEDNLVNQQLVRQWLKKLGYQATLVSNGLEVLSALKQQAYDLILMDVQMPKLDGISATQQIHRLFAHRPKIIAMTANAMKGDREACLEAGMDAYLSKPIQISDLVAAIEQSCSTKHPTVSPSSPHPQTLLDTQVLEITAQSLGGLTQTWLAPFIELFTNQGIELLAQLEKAEEQADCEAIAYVAHTLKSSSAALGLNPLKNCCQRAEEQARKTQSQAKESTPTPQLAQTLQQLRSHFHSSVQALEQFVKTLPEIPSNE